MTVEEIPANNIEPPEWMDAAYLLNAMKEGLKAPELQILSTNIKPATNIGDNYCSKIFRAKLSLKRSPKDEEEQMSIIIKTLPTAGKATEFMSEMSIFKKEAIMLSEVMPKINKILKNVYPDIEPLSADCIWFSNDPEEIMILSDLKELGFANAERRNGLPFDLVKIVLESLGKYHAASYILIKEEPKLLEEFWKDAWRSTDVKEMEPMLKATMDCIIEEVRSWADAPEDYAKRLEVLKETFLEKSMEHADIQHKVPNVLQHGDCWTNNFMYRMVDGRVDGFRFVDFQVSSINSAATDLNYFIFTSPQSDFRVDKIDEMLEIYFKSFMTTIKDLNVTFDKPFTLEQLKEEFIRRLHVGFTALIFIFPITVIQAKDAPDINDFFDENASKGVVYKTEAFKKGFMGAIKYFIDHGIL